MTAPMIPFVPLTPSGSFDPFSCVSYVKYRRDYTGQMVNPRWWWNHGLAFQTDYPVAGLVVITDEGPYWHMAYVESVASGSLELTEANYIPGRVTKRSLPLTSPHIMGYW